MLGFILFLLLVGLVAGFVLGESPNVLGGSLTFATNATAASHVGSYTITPSGLTSTNYTLAFAPGTLRRECWRFPRTMTRCTRDALCRKAR